MSRPGIQETLVGAGLATAGLLFGAGHAHADNTSEQISPSPDSTTETVVTDTAAPATTEVPINTTPEPDQAHTVEQGDTLSTIAKVMGVTVDQLMVENNISDPNRVLIGTVLVRPNISTDPALTESLATPAASVIPAVSGAAVSTVTAESSTPASADLSTPAVTTSPSIAQQPALSAAPVAPLSVTQVDHPENIAVLDTAGPFWHSRNVSKPKAKAGTTPKPSVIDQGKTLLNNALTDVVDTVQSIDLSGVDLPNISIGGSDSNKSDKVQISLGDGGQPVEVPPGMNVTVNTTANSMLIQAQSPEAATADTPTIPSDAPAGGAVAATEPTPAAAPATPEVTASPESEAAILADIFAQADAGGDIDASRYVNYVKQNAPDASVPGYKQMPAPTMNAEGQVDYLFDPTTCNDERIGYPEQIAANILTAKYFNHLLATKYPGVTSDPSIGDVMSKGVHHEHNEKDPATDIRAQLPESPPGAHDGVAFVAMSPNLNLDISKDMIRFAHSLLYAPGQPAVKYIIGGTKSLVGAFGYKSRTNPHNSFYQYDPKHPEHWHLGFYTYYQLGEVPSPADSGGSCLIAGADYVERDQVPQSVAAVQSAPVDASTLTNSDPSSALASSFTNTAPAASIQAHTESAPSLDRLMRPRFAGAADQLAAASEQAAAVGAVATSASTPNLPATTVNTDTAPATVAQPSEINNEYNRFVADTIQRMGSEQAATLLANLSSKSRKILESLSPYIVRDAEQAYQLRADHRGYSEYAPLLAQFDTKLSDEEVMKRAIAAHEMAFGANYDPAQTKYDVEYVTSIADGRESGGRPASVNTFETDGQENNASSGLTQILVPGANIDLGTYQGVRDFDANLDPVQSLYSTFTLIKANRDNPNDGKSDFWQWEAGWKDETAKAKDIKLAKDKLAALQATGLYDSINNQFGGTT